MTRQIDSHRVNPANDKLVLSVLDEPGSGGANHLYHITGFDSASNASDPWTARHGQSATHSSILFQNGPINEVGVNGVTHEVLLAVLIDRMEGFQGGPYASKDNQEALEAMRTAQTALQRRTKLRMARGVEGTHII